MFTPFLSTYENTNTRVAYERSLAHFSAWAEGRGVNISELRPAQLNAYKADLISSGASAATINSRLAAVKAWAAWATVNEEVDPKVHAAAQSVKSAKVVQPMQLPLNEEDIENLRAAVDTSTPTGLRDLALVSFLAATGCRVSEATELLRENVDLNARRALVLGKRGKWRVTRFTADVAEVLAAYLSSTAPDARVFPMTSRRVQQIISALGVKINRPDLHPHLLRHSLGTLLLRRSGGDLQLVQAQLGHEDIRTTERYSKWETSRVDAAYEAAMEKDYEYRLQPNRAAGGENVRPGSIGQVLSRA